MGFFDIFTGGDRPSLVQRALGDIEEMLRTGSVMFADATGALLDNEILERDLESLDDKINACEIDLRQALLEHLKSTPHRELVLSLKLISIVQEAERIGDLAKSIAEMADLATAPRMGELVPPLRALRDRVSEMLENARDSFSREDESLAREIMQAQETLKQDISTYIKTVAMSDTVETNQAVVLVLSARMMSRASSHLANIASTVAAPFDRIRGTLVGHETV